MLETVRLEIPDLEALQAHFESFQDEVQRAQDRIGNFLCQIDEELASHDRMEDSIKQVEVCLSLISSSSFYIFPLPGSPLSLPDLAFDAN